MGEKNSLCPVFDSSFNNPAKFPRLQQNFNDTLYYLTQHAYQSLGLSVNPNTDIWIEDGVVNVFLNYIKTYSDQKGLKTFIMDSELSSQVIFNNNISQGYRDLSVELDFMTYDLIFFPVNTGVHWVLFVVAPLAKCVYHYDSLHDSSSQPESIFVNAIFTF